MNESFKVGEIAIVIGRSDLGELIWPEYHDQEAEIVGALKLRNVWTDRARSRRTKLECYRIRMADGKEMCALPENLRKKRLPPPPREEVGEWELCPWRPLPETV